METYGYTPAHVAECLQRLTMKAVAGPPEGLTMSPEELQQSWQIVSQSAAADLGPETLLHLQLVFGYIEKVINSCGAPDAFDVYEVCFEAMTKIGFCLPQIGAKELLLRAMENVHEVYDVLLSCVETYEWVQPGATGALRLWMLQILFAAFGTRAITGRDLMELTDNDVSGAVGLIAFLLRCDAAPWEMQATAGRCLVQLTSADSVFMNEAEGEPDWQSQKIKELTLRLNRHVNGLIKGLIQFDTVDAFGRCICQHQMSHAHTDIIMKQFLTTIHNCLLYCSENQKKLRQHLATQSTIVQDIMIPYVHNILPALYDNAMCGPALIEWQNLKSTLQTLVVVTFNINSFRPQIRDGNMLFMIFRVPNILTNLSMVELLIKLSINVDFTKAPNYETLLSDLTGAFQLFSPEMQNRLQRRMSSEQSMRLPFSRSNVAACNALLFALQVPAGAADTPDTVAARKTNRRNKWRGVKNKNKRRKRMFAMQHGKDKADMMPTTQAAPEEPEEEDDDDSDDDDMPPLMPAGWESHLGMVDDMGVPTGALCQLSGALMHDPVQTPEGNVFERAALEDWVQGNGSNPLTGAPLDMASCRDSEEIKACIQGYQLQMLSASTIAPEAFDEPPPPACDIPDMPAQPAGRPGWLSDLPSLPKHEEAPPTKKKEKGKIRIESRSVIECPEEMRCAVDGKVMTNPVRSPYGHMFEKKTLERWMSNCGSVCPITGKPLRMEECVHDAEMKKHIVRFLKGQQ